MSSPEIAIAVLAHIVEPLFAGWRERRLGISVLGILVFFLGFADDCWVLANTWAHLEIQCNEFILSLRSAGLDVETLSAPGVAAPQIVIPMNWLLIA